MVIRRALSAIQRPPPLGLPRASAYRPYIGRGVGRGPPRAPDRVHGATAGSLLVHLDVTSVPWDGGLNGLGRWRRHRRAGLRSGSLAMLSMTVAVAAGGLAGFVYGASSTAMAGTVASARTQPAATVAHTAPLRTSCKQVAHLGDSTSDGLISSDFLPDAAQRIPAQYARVGVSRSIMEVVGANSIVETLPGDQNGYEIAQGLVAQGYRGCWVIALGTNDTADVYVGSNVGLATRIQRMMSLIGHQPVLWVNVKTLLSSGPYSETNMQQWDNALLAACPKYPNMRVFNWAHIANPDWFTTDGIHFTSTGSAVRSAAIADALATGFPASAGGKASSAGGAHSCVVNWSPTWHLPTTFLP